MKIPYTVIEEGHVRAVKDTGTFGGVNQWELQVKDANGRFRDVQWMDAGNIQAFFKQKLPVYRVVGKQKIEQI